MKPTFRKTVLDLVEWHQPVILVIIETRIDGSRAHWLCWWNLVVVVLKFSFHGHPFNHKAGNSYHCPG